MNMFRKLFLVWSVGRKGNFCVGFCMAYVDHLNRWIVAERRAVSYVVVGVDL